MGSFALQFQTDQTISIGLKIFCLLTLFLRQALMEIMRGVLTLELEPIAFTHFLVHLFWDGALLGQVALLVSVLVLISTGLTNLFISCIKIRYSMLQSWLQM